MNLVRVFAVASAFMLASCASMRAAHYVEPSSGPRATLSLRGPAGQVLKPDYVFISTYADPANCRQRQFIQYPTNPPSNLLGQGVSIRADEPFMISVGALSGVSVLLGQVSIESCVPMGSFVPTSGESYTAYLAVNSGKCTLDIRSSTGQSVPIKRVQYVAPWDETGTFCKRD